MVATFCEKISKAAKFQWKVCKKPPKRQLESYHLGAAVVLDEDSSGKVHLGRLAKIGQHFALCILRIAELQRADDRQRNKHLTKPWLALGQPCLNTKHLVHMNSIVCSFALM